MSNKDIKVSIIIPVYNSEKYLNDCIQSVVNQTYGNIEIIIVDDGSTDNCPRICDVWKQKDYRIIVIHKQNEGVSKARNIGLNVAKGEYVLYVDSDDIISPILVESLVAQTIDCGRMIVCDMVRFVDEMPQSTSERWSMQHWEKNLLKKRGGFWSCGILYSKELIDKIELKFDDTLRNLEDVVWNGIYCRYISEIVFVDSSYYYRNNPNSITSNCSDYKWQVTSWLAARQSLLAWFKDKELDSSQKKEVRSMFRHCQNNIYAECIAGKLSYRDLKGLETDANFEYEKKHISLLEKNVLRYLPRIYYGLYTRLLSIAKRN